MSEKKRRERESVCKKRWGGGGGEISDNFFGGQSFQTEKKSESRNVMFNDSHFEDQSNKYLKLQFCRKII